MFTSATLVLLSSSSSTVVLIVTTPHHPHELLFRDLTMHKSHQTKLVTCFWTVFCFAPVLGTCRSRVESGFLLSPGWCLYSVRVQDGWLCLSSDRLLTFMFLYRWPPPVGDLVGWLKLCGTKTCSVRYSSFVGFVGLWVWEGSNWPSVSTCNNRAETSSQELYTCQDRCLCAAVVVFCLPLGFALCPADFLSPLGRSSHRCLHLSSALALFHFLTSLSVHCLVFLMFLPSVLMPSASIWACLLLVI